MPINVSAAINSQTAEKIVVERTTVGGYVDGVYVKGTVSTFKTLASVQQPTPKQLEVLPEGERTQDLRVFIAKKGLRSTHNKDGIIADIVTFKGVRFKIIADGDWVSYGYSFSIGARD